MAERGFCRCADQNYAALAALRQLIFWWPRWRCWAGCGTVCLLKFCWNPARPLPCPVLPTVQPLRTAGSRNAASTQAAGSYQATLSIGGWLPVKTVRALVETRPVVTVCGTPFGVKMFSEGALIVGFSRPEHPRTAPPNPAQEGRAVGWRPVVRMDDTLTETNDAVHDALENGRRRTGAGGLISAMVSNSRPG